MELAESHTGTAPIRYYTAVITLHYPGCRPDTAHCLVEQQEREAALAAVRARVAQDWTPWGFEASAVCLTAYDWDGQKVSEERVELLEPPWVEERLSEAGSPLRLVGRSRRDERSPC